MNPLETLMAAFRTTALSAVSMCTGEAQKYFWARHLFEELPRASKTGSAIPMTPTLEGDKIILRGGKFIPLAEIAISDPVIVDGLLVDFRVDGAPIRDVVFFAGCSTGGVPAEIWVRKSRPASSEAVIILIGPNAAVGESDLQLKRTSTFLSSELSVAVFDGEPVFLAQMDYLLRRPNGGFAANFRATIDGSAVAACDLEALAIFKNDNDLDPWLTLDSPPQAV